MRLARKIRLLFLGMYRKETNKHKLILNNFNSYKIFGIRGEKVTIIYITTADIKEIIIIKEITLE